MPRLPKDAQKYLDNFKTLYKEDDELNKFDIIHLYPGKPAAPNGYIDSRWFNLVGFNSTLRTKRELGRHDGLDFWVGGQNFYQLGLMRVFVDGSFLVRFKQYITLDFKNINTSELFFRSTGKQVKPE